MKAIRIFTGVALALTCSSTALASDGARVFADTCQACHQPGGVGSPGLAPPLVSLVIANAANKQKDYAVMVVLNGLSGPLTLADGQMIASAMPPQQGLSDEDIAAVVGYVFRLNRAKTQIKPADIARVRTQAIGSDELRRIRSGLLP